MEESIEIAIDIENQHDPLGSMRAEFDKLSDLSPLRCIYKVPTRLREGNEKAYTPQLVSIGPLHHDDEHLKAMEEHKMRYVRDLLLRHKVSWDTCIKTVKDQVEKLRNCYATQIEFTPDKFVRLVLVDALFLIEFLLRMNSVQLIKKYEDYIFGSPWMNTDIWLDLVMLENQLPFFILEILWEGVAKSPKSILQIAYESFQLPIYKQGEYSPGLEVKHFVDVIRNLCLPEVIKSPARHSTTQLHQAGVKFKVKHCVDVIRNLCLPKETETREKHESIRSTTQLRQAGVKFRVRSTHNLLDIHFANGYLDIPTLRIEDSTESIIRNLVAYEQCHYLENEYICHYVVFMDNLLNTPKDVDLMVEDKILENLLGDSSQVSTLINNLGKGIIWDSNHFYFAEEFERLNAYYTKWHEWKASLKQKYFNTPWAAISVVAAILLLMLTITQTVFSIISVV